MNKAVLVGRLTRDVETRGEGDKALAMFSVACQRPFKNKETGEYEADFIDCKAWGKTAEFISEWFGKGDPIGIFGRIEKSNYTNKNGDTVYATNVIVESAEFVGSKKDKDDDNTPKKAKKKKPVYDDDDEECERPKKKRRPDPDDEDEDEEYESPKKKRRPAPDDDDDEDYERPKKKRRAEDADDDYPF